MVVCPKTRISDDGPSVRRELLHEASDPHDPDPTRLDSPEPAIKTKRIGPLSCGRESSCWESMKDPSPVKFRSELLLYGEGSRSVHAKT